MLQSDPVQCIVESLGNEGTRPIWYGRFLDIWNFNLLVNGNNALIGL